jgi:6-bladed beta-propeller
MDLEPGTRLGLYQSSPYLAWAEWAKCTGLATRGSGGTSPSRYCRASTWRTSSAGKNDCVVRFSKDGRFLKAWGRHGSGPGEFDQPHDISIGGSQGRVFVADRSNSRVQVFDQDGTFIAAWKQFGRPSAVFVSSDDTPYVSDSQSNSTVNPGSTRGITVGSARDGSLRAFIPDPDLAQADVNRIQERPGSWRMTWARSTQPTSGRTG